MLSEPADEPELDDELALAEAASCETDAFRLVSQTSCGITIANSRRTRSQSPSARAPLASMTRDLIQQMIGRGWTEQDFATLLLQQAQASGVKLESENVEVGDGLS